jgi:hypothetical protein
MKILYFFLFLWVTFALLEPDPVTQINADPCGYGSGSETLGIVMHIVTEEVTFSYRDGGQEQRILNSGRLKPAFAKEMRSIKL